MVTQSRPVLILTRPLAASQRFAAEFRARHGDRLDIHIAPLMAPAFRQPALPAPLPNGVLFTSETGVAALARLSERRGPAICVGPRTAEAAQAMGWQAEVLGGDAEGMIAALAAAPRPGRWLHARGEDAITDLAGRLGALGMAVDEAIVYAQKPLQLDAGTHAVLASGRPIIVAVFSPRSARLFVAETKSLPERLQIAAISQAATAAFAGLSTGRIAVAPSPDGAGMLAALDELLDPRAGQTATAAPAGPGA